MKCGICRLMAMMPDDEGPRVPFELMYTHWNSPPCRYGYDNGCNLVHYILNREPEHFSGSEAFIDHFHFIEHNKCCQNFSSAEYPDLGNTPLSEQYKYDKKHKEGMARPGTDRLSAIKQAYKHQFMSNFKSAQTEEGGYNPNSKIIHEEPQPPGTSRRKKSRWE